MMQAIEVKDAEDELPVTNAASPARARWSTWLSSLRTSLRNSRPLAAVFVPAAAVFGFLASRVRDWLVMTDELQYAKLATHISETLSPLPTVRGEHVGAFAQLYPAI